MKLCFIYVLMQSRLKVETILWSVQLSFNNEIDTSHYQYNP